MSDSISQDELISKIMQLNEDDRYHGILVQLPLPNHIDDELIINTIAPNKDVDGFCSSFSWLLRPEIGSETEKAKTWKTYVLLKE